MAEPRVSRSGGLPWVIDRIRKQSEAVPAPAKRSNLSIKTKTGIQTNERGRRAKAHPATPEGLEENSPGLALRVPTRGKATTTSRSTAAPAAPKESPKR